MQKWKQVEFIGVMVLFSYDMYTEILKFGFTKKVNVGIGSVLS